MSNYSEKTAKTVGGVMITFILTIAIAFGLSVVLALPVWLLWNWLMPMIFGLTKLTLIQAWGVTFLSSLLFKSRRISTDN